MDVTGRNAIRVGDILQPDFMAKYNTLKEKHQRIIDCYGYSPEYLTENEEEFFAAIENLRQLNIVNGEYWLNERMDSQILAEGAQGSMLDVTCGTYPFVTSSHTLSGGVCTGLGISPKQIDKIFGVTKAYCTRVGNGPFPTELNDAIGEKIREIGNEFGATTGRPRGCGWVDLVALKYACMLNGVTHLVVTKIDVLDIFEEISICTNYVQDNQVLSAFPFEYTEQIAPIYESMRGWNCKTSGMRTAEEFTPELNDFLTQIILHTGVQISHVSNGANREEIVQL